MTEELKADIMERVLLIGTGFGVMTSGMYLGFAQSMGLNVGSLETAALALGPSALNVVAYTYLVQRRLSQENVYSNLEENINSPRLVPKGLIGGSAASVTLLGLSYGFGYCMGKLTKF